MLVGVFATLILVTIVLIKQKSNDEETNISQYVRLYNNLSEEKPRLQKTITIKNEIRIGESLNDKSIREFKEKKEQEEKKRQEVLARELAIRIKQPSPSFQQGNYEVIGYSNDQCVIYAKKVTGITKSIHYAGTANPEGQTPVVGSIGLMKYYGHAVAVESVNNDGTITVTESNWKKGKIIRRKLSLSDMRGYIY